VPDDPYSDAEIDAAVESLSDPERLREAQDLVAQGLHRGVDLRVAVGVVGHSAAS